MIVNWEDNRLSPESYDRLPRLQNIAGISLFFEKNAASTAFRLHVKLCNGLLISSWHIYHLMFGNFQHHIAAREPWTKINGYWKSFIITIIPKRAVFCDYERCSQHQFNTAPPNVDTSRLEAWMYQSPYKTIWLTVLISSGYVSCKVNHGLFFPCCDLFF